MLSSIKSALMPMCLCFIWYSLSSLTVQMTIHILMRFRYPLFLVQIQSLTNGLFAVSMMKLSTHMPIITSIFPPATFPTATEYCLFSKKTFLLILPLGIIVSLGKCASLCATSIVPVATVVSIKSLSPLFIVVGYRIFYSLKVPASTFMSLLPLIGGVIMIVSEDAADVNMKSNIEGFSGWDDTVFIKGLVFSLISVILMATQQIYGKKVISWEKPSGVGNDGLPIQNQFMGETFTHLNNPLRSLSYRSKEEDSRPIIGICHPPASMEHYNKPDKLTIIIYSSSIGFCISSVGCLGKKVYSLVADHKDSLYDEGDGISPDAVGLVPLILLLSLCHFAQTLMCLFVLGSISTLSFSVASMMKRVVVITVSLLVAQPSSKRGTEKGTRLTKWQTFGLLFIACGLFIYRRWGDFPTSRHHT